MKTSIAILSLILVAVVVRAEKPRFLLVPLETSIKPGSKATFDVYVWNDSRRPVSVPSLDFISTVTSSKNSGTAEVAGKTSTSTPDEHSLSPNSVEWKRITSDIKAQPGDLIEVYVQIGSPPRLRSNSVLLFCPK
jgi:hypothetical protein